jgi:ATPase family protein associated with various cellular activities (AAA)
MNAPQSLAPPNKLIEAALHRLADVSHAAGHPDWVPPALPVFSARLELATQLANLDRGEALTVALLLAVECDPSVARMIATIQAPVGGSRVLAGLAASLFAPEQVSVVGIWGSRAVRAGLINWGDEAAPLPERTLSMPPWLVAALSGFTALPPGVSDPTQPPVILPSETRKAAAMHAQVLTRSGLEKSMLVIRAHCPAEGEAMAEAVVRAAGCGPCIVNETTAPGLAVWLAITDRHPIFHRSAGPGETIDLTPLDCFDAPLIVVAGADGQVVSARRQREWRAAMPGESERKQLWRGWGLSSSQANAAALRYRQSAGRIAELGRSLAASQAARSVAGIADVMKISGGRIDALARRADADVSRDDIVLPTDLGDSLARLIDRILLRNRLHEGLGSTIAARYKPGVRALFTGDSGTGKTLAVHWLAREAGLPLYRVDLAALTSKWIGETEKNLSQLLDAAEQGDVLLFFDEADSLFGARTDVSDAHDRYANSQTNFLLQRIEEYEGVAILATNSRDRFDPAFVRRFDMVLEFPLPDAPARRRLWDCHLGEAHEISSSRLDRLAAAVDLTGGHVRNVVLAASARARAEGRMIVSTDLDAAIAEEYAKLGRTAPSLPPG